MGEVHQLLMKHGLTEVRRSMSGDDKHGRLCVEAAHAVMSDERSQIGIAHAGFAMAALPHRRIDETVWERDGGPIKLLVESGLDSSRNPVGVPYGAIARMILLYLQTQAVKTQSRDVELGNSMNAWLTAMNISVGGKTYQMVREQARRISRCRLTFFNRTADHEYVSNGAFVRDAIFPLEHITAGQGRLWQEVVRLDESFYQSLIDHPLPLRDVAIAQISNRSMAIDIYIWLAYRLHALDRPIDVTWAALKSQFGSGYKELRFFRRDMMPSLKLALSVYPEARVIVDETKGLTLHPSAAPIPERRIAAR